MKKIKKERYIPTKNYVILAIIIVAIALACLYAYKWNEIKKAEKLLTSYLISSNTISSEINDIDELEVSLKEVPNKYYVYISYTMDEDIYNIEQDLKPVIDKYNLQDNFYYINVTDLRNTNHYLDDIAEVMNLSEDSIKSVPVILYFENGTLVDTYTDLENFAKYVKINTES